MGNSLGKKKDTTETNEAGRGDDSESASSPGDSENAVTPEEETNEDEPPPGPEGSANPENVHEQPTEHSSQFDAGESEYPSDHPDPDHPPSSPDPAFKLPKGWQKKCQQDPKWCTSLLKQTIAAEETDQLFEGKPRPHLNAAQKERAEKGCKRGIGGDPCRTLGLLHEQVQVYLSKRDGYLGLDGKGLSTGVWTGVVGGVLLLVGAIILFFLGCGAGKGKEKKGASRSKSSKLKSKSSKLKSKRLKSKGGKSRASKISSRKSRKSGKALRSKSGKTGKALRSKSGKTGKGKK